jgi:hypothetical protein
VLVDVVAMHKVQVAIVQIVGMAIVKHCRVPATGAVQVAVLFVNTMFSSHQHCLCSPPWH